MEVLIVLIKKSYWNLQKEEEQNTESVIVGVTTRYGGKVLEARRLIGKPLTEGVRAERKENLAYSKFP